MNLSNTIEAILFWKGEPVEIKELSKLCSVSDEEIKLGISALDLNLKNRGVTLIKTDDSIMLATATEASLIIENLHRDEINKDLGKAGLETLAIVLYKHPISRREIDYIRGVNSAFIVRNLLIRGLIEKIEDTENKRNFLYKPTINTISFLGLSSIADLPDYEETLKLINGVGDENSIPVQNELTSSPESLGTTPDNESIEKPIDTSLSDIDNTYHVGKDEKKKKQFVWT